MLKGLFKVEDEKRVRPARLLGEEELGEGLSAVGWEHCFDQCISVNGPSDEPGSSFCVYLSGDVASAECVWVLLHGAGQAALVWAHLVAELRPQLPLHAFVAYDARGHGQSHHTLPDQELLLSRQRQALDCAHVVGNVPGLAGRPICLVGHSMGGMCAVEAAALPQIKSVLQAVVVLDVVEGTAMASIPAIAKYVNSRPASFSSVAQAIRWTVDSQTVRSEDSARVSVPPQLRQVEDGTYVWRTNLAATSQYWKEWYEKMSDRFLAISVQKMLMLAGMDRLDKPLMIGQMQGKYQLVVLPQCGHQLHEEAPAEVARKFADFANRYLRLK